MRSLLLGARPARCALVCCLTAAIPATLEAYSSKTIALTGEPVPGAGGGLVFGDDFVNGDFNTPIINERGQLMFTGGLSGAGTSRSNDRALFLYHPDGTYEIVARQGDAAVGTDSAFDGFAFETSHVYNLDDYGNFSFYSPLGGPDFDDTVGSGAWRGTSKADLSIVRNYPQTPAPGTEPGTTVGRPGSSFTQYMDPNGRFLMPVRLTGPGVVPYPNEGWNYRALFLLDENKELQLLGRDGDPAPGTDEVFGVYREANFNYGMNNEGTIIITSGLSVDGLRASQAAATGRYESGIWGATDGTDLQLLIESGDPAPGAEGYVFRQIGLGGADVSVNESGEFVFWASITNEADDRGTGIWKSSTSGGVELVALTESQAPGLPEGYKIRPVGDPLIGAGGQMVVRGAFHSPDSSSGGSGIWVGTNADNLRLIAKTNNPSTDEDTLGISNLLRSHAHSVMNEVGQLVFTAGVESDLNHEGLFAYDDEAGLRKVFASGDQLEVKPGDYRTINRIVTTYGRNGVDAQAVHLNNHGDLAFRATFTDGTEGIFMTNINVPEPASLCLLLSLTALQGGRYRAIGR